MGQRVKIINYIHILMSQFSKLIIPCFPYLLIPEVDQLLHFEVCLIGCYFSLTNKQHCFGRDKREDTRPSFTEVFYETHTPLYWGQHSFILMTFKHNKYSLKTFLCYLPQIHHWGSAGLRVVNKFIFYFLILNITSADGNTYKIIYNNTYSTTILQHIYT